MAHIATDSSPRVPLSSITGDASRLLSDCLLVNRMMFVHFTAEQQTTELAKAGGLPVIFVPDWKDMLSRKKLVDDLLSGKDVSRQLEFLGEKLNKTDAKRLEVAIPIISRLHSGPKGVTPEYPWLNPDKTARIATSSKALYHNGSYVYVYGESDCIHRSVAKQIWLEASAYWNAGRTDTVTGTTIKTSRGYTHTYVITEDRVKVGCKEAQRLDIEALASALGWEPNI